MKKILIKTFFATRAIGFGILRDLIYKLEISRTDFSIQLRKVRVLYKQIGFKEHVAL